MKHGMLRLLTIVLLSPPPTGAWIETVAQLARETHQHMSPPPTGAWIETQKYSSKKSARKVAPSHGGVD